jgi:hypothetical protein
MDYWEGLGSRAGHELDEGNHEFLRREGHDTWEVGGERKLNIPEIPLMKLIFF